ncbi:MAG: CHAD domain-containing protein, partial [Gammaproteobacteria bacterium]|nr:CHAD domain-containing protein [Gammaproteobacteria bacterium]
MILPFSYFDLPNESHSDDIIRRLNNHLAAKENPARLVSRTYLDTFDWRLFAAGLQLEYAQNDHHHSYVLQQVEAQHTIATIRTPEPIRFVWDLPEGVLKKQLAPLIEMRALLPVVSLRSKFRELDILNKEEKTVLRVRVEENKLLKTSSHPGILLNRGIVLHAIRGYKKNYDAALTLLQDELHLTPSKEDVYTKALIKSKIVPGQYSSKLTIALDPQMRADAASKKILLLLLNTLQANHQGTIEDIDSEFLHDFRVACRRTRSALSQIKEVFPQKTTDRYKREFAWLGEVTGPTRDLDVYLLTFDDYKKRVPEHLQGALEPLHEFLRKQQTLEQKKLAQAIQSVRYQRLITGWRQFLEAPVPIRPSAANADRSIIAVGSDRTWKMYKRVINEGEAIRDNSPPDDLHELRKSCKKLRYLMEFFHSLYAEEKITKLIKALKQLQSNLGDYNDLHVQIESLERFS